MIPVQIKLLEGGKLPEYKSAKASGADLYAAEDVIVRPGETVLVRTGIALCMPDSDNYGGSEEGAPVFEVQIRDRSGLAAKTKLRVANSPGTIDEDFLGEIKVIIDNINYPQYKAIAAGVELVTLVSQSVLLCNGEKTKANDFYPVGTYRIRKGDRIAQAVFTIASQMEFEVVEAFDKETERGESGFGHTGTR